MRRGEDPREFLYLGMHQSGYSMSSRFNW